MEADCKFLHPMTLMIIIVLYPRRNRTVDAYRAEASCMMRLRHEIIQLRAVNQSQEELIHSLSLENKRLKASRTNIGNKWTYK